MGTVFEIFIAGKTDAYAGQTARAGFEEIDRLERLFSRFDESSEIRRIGRLASGEAIPVGIEVYDCLDIAERVRLATGGAFDANVRTLIKWKTPDGFALGRPAAPDKEPGSPVRPGIDIDLGGIGKGYALDRVREVLADWSVFDALLQAGTSTALAIGSAPGQSGESAGWPVGIASAWKTAGHSGEVVLRDRAVSGSGFDVKGGHILDPRTGRIASGHAAAWAAHKEAAAADALSTAFMVMDDREVERFCRDHRNVWAFVVDASGRIRIFNDAALRESQGVES
jgi:FAD:protein FMN transferase